MNPFAPGRSKALHPRHADDKRASASFASDWSRYKFRTPLPCTRHPLTILCECLEMHVFIGFQEGYVGHFAWKSVAKGWRRGFSEADKIPAANMKSSAADIRVA